MGVTRCAAVVLLALAGLGCHGAHARLAYGSYPSRAMRTRMQYAVYTPPHFRADERLPVVLFLHGGGDEPNAFDRWHVGQALDRAIAAGRIPRVVVVLPEGDLGFWRNWADHTRLYEDWVLGELLPRVQRAYHTRTCPDGCHVMGVSMGGAGALHFAMRYPSTFASAAMISAPIFDTDQMLAFAQSRLMQAFIPVHRIWGEPTRAEIEREDPFLVWKTPSDVGPRLFLAWAAHDGAQIRDSSERLHRHLEDIGVPHGHVEFAGGHDWRSWTPVIVDALRFMVPEP